MQRRSLILGFGLALAAAGSGFIAGIIQQKPSNVGENSQNNHQDRAQIKRLLSLSLNDARGAPVALASWRGKVLVVNYWAAWCPPCRDEMPGFSRLARELAEKNVQFVGIGIDSADNIREFANESPVTYPLLVADAQAIAIAKNLGNSMGALPFTVIVGADGSIRDKHLGSLKEATLREILQR